MPDIFRILKSIAAGARPTGKSYGEPYVNFAENQFGVIDNTNAARDLLGAPLYSINASYPAGVTVAYQGRLWVSNQAVSFENPFNYAHWNQLAQIPLTSVQLGAGVIPSLVPMLNGTVVATVSGNALTVAIKTLAGADPSVNDYTYFITNNGVGGYNPSPISGPLSVTVPAGATHGISTNGAPFKLWLAVFNTSPFQLALFQSTILGSTNQKIVSLDENVGASALAYSSGGLNPGTWYSGSAISGTRFRILACLEWSAGLPTAGQWSVAPSYVHLFGPGVPRPGTVLSTWWKSTSTLVSFGTGAPVALGLSSQLSLQSAANGVLIHGAIGGIYSATAALAATFFLTRNGPGIYNPAVQAAGYSQAGPTITGWPFTYVDLPWQLTPLYDVAGQVTVGSGSMSTQWNGSASSLIMQEIAT
jgi:hypothetical protein